MIVRYESCDDNMIEERVDTITFYTTNDGAVELVCQRSEDNPYYKPDDGFGGKFYVDAQDVEWVRK